MFRVRARGGVQPGPQEAPEACSSRCAALSLHKLSLQGRFILEERKNKLVRGINISFVETANDLIVDTLAVSIRLILFSTIWRTLGSEQWQIFLHTLQGFNTARLTWKGIR